jgi:hypothetical protein
MKATYIAITVAESMGQHGFHAKIYCPETLCVFLVPPPSLHQNAGS